MASFGLDENGAQVILGTSPLPIPSNDVLVAIPGGGVGRHALYSIIENLMAQFGQVW